jgi:hypothetical protein
MPKHKHSHLTPEAQAQSVAYIAGFIGYLIAYLGAEAVFVTRPHPLHWITAFGLAALVGVAAYFLALRHYNHTARK